MGARYRDVRPPPAEDATMPNDRPRPIHDGGPGGHVPPDVLRWLDAPAPEWPNAPIPEDVAALGFPDQGGGPAAGLYHERAFDGCGGRGPGTDIPDPPEARAARIAREGAMIDRARASLDAGFGIPWEEAEAWLDALDRDPHAPLPVPPGRPDGGP